MKLRWSFLLALVAVCVLPASVTVQRAQSTLDAVDSSREGIYLNEYLVVPRLGDSQYIELYNSNPFAITVSGWQVDDAEGGSRPVTLSGQALIPALGFMLLESSFGLNDAGDTVRLIGPDGVVRDSHSYTGNPGIGVPWSRYPDGVGGWRTDLPPSPGQPNPPPPPPSPTPTASPTPAGTPTPTVTPGPSPTPTPTPTATPIPGGIFLNEYLPAAAFAESEYIELYNSNPFAVSVSGWQVDDAEGGSRPVTLSGQALIPALGFMLLEFNLGLNNDGDTVRLIDPEGVLRDSHSYTENPGIGVPWSRYPDGVGSWRTDLPPSPGQPNPPPPPPSPTPTASPTPAGTPTPTATPGPSPTPTPTPTATPIPGGIFLNEYLPAAAFAESEYIELYNSNPFAVSVSGWQVDDAEGGSHPYTLSGQALIPALGFMLLESSFGLNNDGDTVRLIDPEGVLRDSHSYTENPGIGVPWSRYPDGVGAWRTDLPPSPGQPNPPPPPPSPTPSASPTPAGTPTPTATPGPSPTPTPTPTATPIPGGIFLNEYLPAAAFAESEYIELYNSNPFAVSVSGWQVDDAEGGSHPYTLSGQALIPALGFMLLESGFGLNDDGDTVRLIGPDGVLRDSHSYTENPGIGVPWSRYPDGVGAWRTDLPPSPGQPNPPPPTITPTPTATPTSTATPTPSPTTTATPIPGGVVLNEYLPAPPVGVSEYVELFNTNPFPVDLSGWQVDDEEGGASPYTLPAGSSIPALGHLLLERTFGLNNDGDTVRLIDPEGVVRDSHSYTGNPGIGVPWSRYPDGVGAWRTDLPPSPGQPNPSPPPASPTPTPTPTATPIPGGVVLNEYLPAPPVGVSEYVELFNANPFAVDLSGWKVDDEEGGISPYTLPAGSSIPALGHLLLERTFGLNNDGDTVRLIDPEGVVRDSHSYTGNPGIGVPWSRYPDGVGAWRTDLPPSPGQPNPPPPPASPTPTPTPTATPIPGGVVLNEYLPAPPVGVSEYVELFNANPFAVDLSGWQVDDEEGGTSPYTLPAGSSIPALGHLLLERTFGLNNDGDTVRLIDPEGVLRDSHTYAAALRNIPWSRAGDGAPAWSDRYPRTPGQPNRPASFTLSGRLLHGHPPETANGMSGRYIGLYGGDDPTIPTVWLANAFTGPDGDYSLTFDTSVHLFRYYTLRPSPLPGYEYVGARSLHGEVLALDRIRFAAPGNEHFAGNDFWLAPLPTPTPTSTALPPDFVVLNEILPNTQAIDFNGDGIANQDDEYIELYNPRPESIDLSGWWLDDRAGASSPYRLPPGAVIGPHGFLLFFRSQTRITFNNSADSARLLAPDGLTEIDRFDYSSSRPDTPWSRSVDGGGEWTNSYPPSPGGPNLPPPTPAGSPTATITPTPGSSAMPTVTATITASPSPTPSPTPTVTPAAPGFVTLNEILPNTQSVDFNGDGVANQDDEYIELYNPQAQAIDLSGWWLDDRAGASSPYRLPPGTLIGPHGFLLLFRSQTRITFNNSADSARLLAPDGLTEIDRFDYSSSRPDTPWSRSVDGGGEWTNTYPPSPGGPNLPPPPTATPTATLTLTPSPTQPPAGAVTLNEILPNTQAVDFNGDGVANQDDEYIELYNPQAQAIDLSGWWLDDRAGASSPYRLPPGTLIEPHGFLLFFRSQTRITFNNSADSARLLAPDGLTEIDRFDYSSSRPDTPWSRSVDGGGEWTNTYPPSPGGPNLPPPPTVTPTATLTPTLTPTPWPTPADGAISFNEILPAPRSVDWDGDSVADFRDEWLEIYNSGAIPADLGGWRLWKGQIGPDGRPDGFYSQLPSHTLVQPGGFLLLFHRQTDLSLPDGGETLHLVRPDGRIADSFSWDRSPGYDRSFSRYPDGSGPWGVWDVTPGRPNTPFAQPDPTPEAPPAGPPQGGLGVGVEPIRRAYELALDTRMTVEGWITASPGLFDRRILYLQDASGGLKLYLRQGDFPTLHLGDRLRATGFLHEFHGQRELQIPGPTWLAPVGPGAIPQPYLLRTGRVGRTYEGQLVLVVGGITGFSRNSFWLDDGSSEVRVLVDENLPWQRPFFNRGDRWAVVGVVSSFAGEYRILPRYAADISAPPAVLPVTGAQAAGP